MTRKSQNEKIKTVDYKIISDNRCPDCNRPLKQNKVNKGHRHCFICFKIKAGKRYQYVYEVINRMLTIPKKLIKTIDRIELQRQNRIRYGWKR
jgi:ribosomal protein L37AE/L43A